MNLLHVLCALLIGYLLGCFQTSYFISKIIINKDIRNLGSGNAGASNITSEMGWKYGIFTAILDILKAYASVYIVSVVFINSFNQLDLMVIAGSSSVIGHIFPFFMKFKGGKGIACYIGILLALDFNFGIISILAIILITIVTDYVSIGSILLYTIIPLLIYFSDNYSTIILLCSMVLSIVGIIKHWININRIINKTEIGLRSVIYKNK